MQVSFPQEVISLFQDKDWLISSYLKHRWGQNKDWIDKQKLSNLCCCLKSLGLENCKNGSDHISAEGVLLA